MTEVLVGKVEKKSLKTNGVKVWKRWYNATEEVVRDIEVGKEYYFTLDEDKTIISADEIKEENQEKNEKEEWFKRREKQIRRLALLNTATEILKTHNKPLKVSEVLRVAKELEKWVIE